MKDYKNNKKRKAQASSNLKLPERARTIYRFLSAEILGGFFNIPDPSGL